MALVQLYTAADASVLVGPYESWSVGSSYGFYLRRYDCVAFYSSSYLGSIHKIYRDGTVVRVTSMNSYPYLTGYDQDVDLTATYFSIFGTGNYYNDPISMKYDPSKPAALTYSGVIIPGAGGGRTTVWQGAYYQTNGGSTFYKLNLTTGAVLHTYSLPASITPFSADRLAITQDGIGVLLDFDNGTYGVAKFYNISTNTYLYTSTFARSQQAFVDSVNNNIWSIGTADTKMRTYSFQPAPSTFTPISWGTNHKRFREDAITATLKGSNGELITNWPVGWILTGTEGNLDETFSLTDENGVATNKYCGPGVDDYLGGDMTIEAWTGY